ncbi:MAG: hypothetical protein V9E85_04575 [Candidatus Nanopelagicales bacterium]
MKTSYAVAALSAALTLGIAPAVLANDAVSAPATPHGLDRCPSGARASGTR